MVQNKKTELLYDVDLVSALKESNCAVWNLLENSQDLEDARQQLFSYLVQLEKELIYSDEDTISVPQLEKTNAKKCIDVMKNIISPLNEKKSGFSSLSHLMKIVKGEKEDVSECFLIEFIHLFRGIICESGIYSGNYLQFTGIKGRKAAIARSNFLDSLSKKHDSFVKKYPTGIDIEVVKRRQENKERIINYFKATEEDWNDWRWQLKNVIRNSKVLGDLIQLSPETKEAIDLAVKNRIPFGITPYYLSLMDYEQDSGFDDTVRAQVIPSLKYVQNMVEHKFDKELAFDFMREHDTSPVDLVTRRYPKIAILKPYNTCPQICVYCQRNWEIEEVLAKGAMASKEKINESIKWFEDHPSISEVLITGGDPGIMPTGVMEYILERVCAIEHVEKVRIATRTLVTMPQRITDEWVNLLAKYNVPGKRHIYVMTHIEHPYEITPETMKAAQKIKMKGITVLNQVVYTAYNSRRFENVALRKTLKLIGIDPYYTFYPKGKKEAPDFLIPVARILQERKEEARLLPGSSRTDEPVFNVPGLGKNHLRAAQDREVIMILPDGSRIIEFHPWEKMLNLVEPYLHRDIPITEYLEKLAKRGENLSDYSTIWYYY